MRRSSKASQLINLSGHNDTYKFRCMQYLNFVLDQVVNSNNKFKIYSSHIESLLRNNLNEISIQDIQKIKRMIDEGQKIKTQTQETGEFINYDLIQKKKYLHDQTYYQLEKAPEQALFHLCTQNQYTLNEIQIIKNQNKSQRLEDYNYSILDSMFRLPEQNKIQPHAYIENILPLQIDQQIRIQKNMIQKQNHQNPSQRQDEKKVQEVNVHANQEIQNKEQLFHKVDVEEKSKAPVLLTQKKTSRQADIDISFVEIKQKKKQKKRPSKKVQISPQNKQIKNLQVKAVPNESIKNQETIHINNKAVTQQIAFQQLLQIFAPILVSEQKKDEQNEQIKCIQNQKDQNIANTPTQKRKYIRKKPLQPRKTKSQRQKAKAQTGQQKNNVIPSFQLQKNQQIIKNDKIIVQNVDGQKIQPSQVLLKQLQPKQVQIKEVQYLQIQNIQNQVNQNKVRQSEANVVQIKLEKKVKQTKSKKSIQAGSKVQNKQKNNESKQSPIKKQKKVKKHQKVSQQIKIQSLKKPLQIVLPYPDCQEIREQLSKQAIHVIAASQVMDQPQNMEHPVIIHSPPSPGMLEIISHSDIRNWSLVDQLYINNKVEVVYPQQINVQVESILAQADSKLLLSSQNIERKKSKVGAKSVIVKKQIKKESSQSYKPAEDDIQSVSQQAQKNGGSQVDQTDKKSKKKIKIKKSISSKQKVQKPSSIQQQKVQTLENIGDGSQKEKRRKLTAQQRQRLKQQKQKLKQMRNKEREEKRKQKQLQKLQKQIKKVKKQPQQKLTKDKKKKPKLGDNSISINESNSFVLIANAQQKKETSPAKKIQIFNVLGHKLVKQPSVKSLKQELKIDNDGTENLAKLMDDKQKSQKVPKQISIQENFIREEIRLNSISLPKQISIKKLQIIEQNKQNIQNEIGQSLSFIQIQPQNHSLKNLQQELDDESLKPLKRLKKHSQYTEELAQQNIKGSQPVKRIKKSEQIHQNQQISLPFEQKEIHEDDLQKLGFQMQIQQNQKNNLNNDNDNIQ